MAAAMDVHRPPEKGRGERGGSIHLHVKNMRARGYALRWSSTLPKHAGPSKWPNSSAQHLISPSKPHKQARDPRVRCYCWQYCSRKQNPSHSKSGNDQAEGWRWRGKVKGACSTSAPLLHCARVSRGCEGTVV